jgi:hypothetical protein
MVSKGTSLASTTTQKSIETVIQKEKASTNFKPENFERLNAKNSTAHTKHRQYHAPRASRQGRI